MLGGEYTEEEMRYYERREGRIEGKAKAEKEMITAMLKNGLSVERVARITKMSEDSIRDILQQLE